jgi:deoxyhypusine monooxygenase
MAVIATENDYAALEATLTNASGNVPLAKRFRALFTLKALADKRAVEIIGKGVF